nr:hypothetical protein Itr_chr06CG10740 [Ipomoea trifida]
MPTGDHQSYPPLLPTQNVFTNNEILISPLQIERLDSQLEANILEEGREASTIQPDENAITQGEVEACVINEAQVEVPAENLVEELVEVETTAEVEEQVMIPNVTYTQNISISVIVPVEVICEGVVTAQDETLVETNLDESQHGNATNVPTVTQSHEMDVTENLSNTLEDTNENLFENLIDAQVIDEEHLRGNATDHSFHSPEIKGIGHTIKAYDEEFSKNMIEDDENLLSSLFMKVNECQEDISTRIANAMEVRRDIQKHIYEDIYNQMKSLSDRSQTKFGAIQYFSDDRIAPYTMEDVPAIMRKHAEGDQILWIAKKNQGLKKGKSSANSNMNMLKEIEQYAEAYSYYITGQVYDEYFVDKYIEDFRKLREHINKMLEKRSMEKSRT